MAKDGRVTIDLGYVVGTQMQADISRISYSLKAMQARLILKDMYDSKCITEEEYQEELRRLWRMIK